MEKTSHANGSSDPSHPGREGIQLALDPNLITLPLHASSTTPVESETNNGTLDQRTPLSDDQNKHDADQEAPNSSLRSSVGHSLIENPYEIYGQLPLGELIPLILQQKGPGFKFADLSEDQLLKELETEANVENETVDQTGANNTPTFNDHESTRINRDVENDIEMDIDYQDAEPGVQEGQMGVSASSELDKKDFANCAPDNLITQEQFLRMRREMIDHVNLAMNESSLALEFLSLLLSSVKESTALTSMSPFLKKTVPVGSLNSDKLPFEPVSKEERMKAEVLNRGWKLRSLNESRAILKDNFESLESVLSKERVYWDEISKYISNKDVIFKIRDKSTGLRSLGIKYGYQDSGSSYKADKGVAILRNSSDHNLLELVPSRLIESPMSKQNDKFIRLRIFTKIESEDDYILTGETSPASQLLRGSTSKKYNDDIRAQIEKLKAVVFEQELMYQLKKECSLLISYGVTIENEDKVVMELPNEKIEMELISIDDSSVVNHIQDAPKVNDRRATLALTTLRMLLVVIYKKNLKKRLTSKRGDVLNVEKDILLIRPILGRMRHQNYKILLRRIIKDYVLDVIKDSSIKEGAIYKQEMIEKAIDSNIAKLSKEISAFDQVLETSKTKFEIFVPGKSELILILSSPNYCNALVSIVYEDELNQVSFNTTFSEFKEIEEFLNFLVTEYIKNKNDMIKKEE